MSERDVADLVCYDSGHLSFVGGRFDQTSIDEREASRQRERVDVSHVDDFVCVSEFRMLELGRYRLGEPSTHPRDVGVDLGVVQQRHLSFDFGGRLTPELYVLVRAVRVLWSRDPRRLTGETGN